MRIKKLGLLILEKNIHVPDVLFNFDLWFGQSSFCVCCIGRANLYPEVYKKFLSLFQTRATTVPNLIDRIKFDFSAKVAPRGGEVLPCLSHIGMCFPKGYGFGGFLF